MCFLFKDYERYYEIKIMKIAVPIGIKIQYRHNTSPAESPSVKLNVFRCPMTRTRS